jgi:hypothetical protein
MHLDHPDARHCQVAPSAHQTLCIIAREMGIGAKTTRVVFKLVFHNFPLFGNKKMLNNT